LKETARDFLLAAEEHLRRENPAEALRLAAERLRHVPTDAAALGIYCDALIVMGRREEARAVLDEVPKIIDGLNIIFERAGDACREKGYHREAAACYEKFLSLRPDTERSREIIGKMTLLEQEDILCPDHDLTGQGNDTEQDFFTVTMAQLYIQQGHIQDAESMLEKIIHNEPDNTEAVRLLDQLRLGPPSPSAETKESSAKNSLVKILSRWLQNIERLKVNAAAK